VLSVTATVKWHQGLEQQHQLISPKEWPYWLVSSAVTYSRRNKCYSDNLAINEMAVFITTARRPWLWCKLVCCIQHDHSAWTGKLVRTNWVLLTVLSHIEINRDSDRIRKQVSINLVSIVTESIIMKFYCMYTTSPCEGNRLNLLAMKCMTNLQPFSFYNLPADHGADDLVLLLLAL